ncbi:serine/threonine-protein kinase [Maioricimonas sp. JC845]|uniref:serine/threonine-protein kinase n=1 Tax=Maioricimonas sp. JC845 TaxID=3232138 RepID=UPI00345972AD
MSASDQPVSPEDQAGDAAVESVDPQSVEGVFVAALTKSPEERAAFLDEICGDDSERRMRVEALLAAYEDAGSFLEKPASNLQGRFGPTSTTSLDFLEPSDTAGSLGRIGQYEVLDLIGRGGMGMVLRAADPKLNRVVAVKVLAPELAVNPNARRRFLREAQAAAAISHPHVVTIHAVDDNNPPYLVMECIVGQSLQDRLNDEGALPLTEILRIGKQVSEGLAAAHAEGLIHRDIKPSNILLENGVQRVKITDFGLARAVDDATITRTGEVSGTPQYMSPEQARGERLDHRSDMFSLGCVLYAMCTGRSPFRSSSLAEAVKRVTDDAPRPIAEINPDLPPWLVQIVEQLLEKDPAARPQSAEQLADLLGRHLAEIQRPPGARQGHEAINAEALAEASARRSSRRTADRPLPATSLASGSNRLGTKYVRGLAAATVAGGLMGLWLSQAANWPRQLNSAGMALLLIFALAAILRRLIPLAGRFSWPMWVLSLFSLMLFLWTTAFTVAAVAERSEVEQFGWLLLAALGLINVLAIWLTIRLLSRSPAIAASSIWTKPRTIPRWSGVTLVLIVVTGIFGKAWYDGRPEPDITAGKSIQRADPADIRIAPGSTPAGNYEGGMSGGPGMSGMEPVPAAVPPAQGALTLIITDPAVQVWLESKPEEQKQSPMDEMDGMSMSSYGDMGMMGAQPGGAGDYGMEMGMGGEYGGDMFGGYFGSYSRSFSGKDSPRTVELPAGAYLLHITIEGTGWEKADGSRAVTGYTDEVTVKPGETVARTIQADLNRLATAAPDFSRPGLYRFHWPSTPVPTLLSQPQARVVQRLFKAYAAGTPAVAEKELLTAAFPATNEAGATGAEEGPDRPQTLEELFNDGQHPAWGRLIVPAEKGTWRLAPFEDETSTDDRGTPMGSEMPGSGTPAGEGSGPASSRPIRGGYGGASGAPLERRGTLVIDLRSTGMLVAVRRKSSFDRITLSEETITTMGQTALQLPPGEYEVLMRDELAGWSTREIGTPIRDRIESLFVRQGTTTQLIVRRDLKRNLIYRARSRTENEFYWNGTRFRLVSSQVAPVTTLLKALIDGEPDVDEATLLSAAGESQFETVTELFRETTWRTPSGERTITRDRETWLEGNLVIPGEKEGTWRLSPPVWGTVEIDVKAPGFRLTIPPQDGEGPSASWFQLQPAPKFTIELPVGSASLQLYDNLVHWDEPLLGNSRTETSTVTISSAEPVRVLVDRTPEDLRAVADFEWSDRTNMARFDWPLQVLPPFSGWGGSSNHISRDQAAVIRVLLRAYADGQPEVPEKQLLERAGLEDRTFAELFPPETRNQLGYLIAGQDEGTWRLAPLPEGFLNRPEDANEPSKPADADEEPPMPMDNAA